MFLFTKSIEQYNEYNSDRQHSKNPFSLRSVINTCSKVFRNSIVACETISVNAATWKRDHCDHKSFHFLYFALCHAQMLNRFSSFNDANQDHHNGDNQKNVNKTTHGVGRNQPQEP
jgi:hypothetical protein